MKEGFYPIPGFSNYACNENGDVLNIEKNTLNNWEIKGKAFEKGPTEERVIQETDGTGSVKKELRMNFNDRPELYRQPKFSGIKDYSSFSCQQQIFLNRWVLFEFES
mgnify:CR=1 FL=1